MKRLLIVILILFVLSYTLSSSDENFWLSKSSDNVFLNLRMKIKNEKELQKRLSSGLPNKLIISVQVKDKSNSMFMLNRDFIFEAIYDVWEEKYRLFSYNPEKRLIFETRDKNEIYKRFLSQGDIRLFEISQIRPDSLIQIKIKVLVNPVSKDIIEKIKEYLSDPEMAARGGSTRTIFGSFANKFIPELNTEDVIKYEFKSVDISALPLKK